MQMHWAAFENTDNYCLLTSSKTTLLLSTCYHKIVPIHHKFHFSTLPRAQVFESLNLSLQIIKYPSSSFFSHSKRLAQVPHCLQRSSVSAERMSQCHFQPTP